MNAYEYVVINEYGAIMQGTAAESAQACEYNAVGAFGQDWQAKGLCICQLVPVPIVGKPAGYWHSDQRKHPGT